MNNTTSIRYKDFDLNFTRHPVTSDVGVKLNNESIKQSLRNLVNLNYFEFPYYPDLGSNIRSLLFENVGPMTAINIKQHIEQMILNYEPRVELSEVKIKADSDNNAYDCFISYFIKNIELPFTFNFLLKQIR